jgi:uncharacterized protein (TIGR00159 family)
VLAELGWADALDVGIVAALVYAGIAWLRRSSGALVAAGLALVAGLYLAARLLDLELTTRLFQSLAAISLVLLVVVFQEELRQAFEELASRALRRRTEARPRLDTRHILVDALFGLAREKIGALVVIPGAQLLDRHCHGGVELDGRLSRELLDSLFDPHSDGHDGAVVVENRRVRRFGVHLPLSRLAPARTGTRHAAALGLAERTDALCIVVSEERGSVSVAQDGRLREAPNPDVLGHLVDAFHKDRHPLSRRRTPLLRWFADDAPAKLAAAGIACALWLVLVPGSQTVETAVTIPVLVRALPPALELQGVEPAEVVATFEGTRRDAFFLSTADVRLEIDASLAELGRRTFELSARNLSYPDGLELQGLDPEKVQIDVR